MKNKISYKLISLILLTSFIITSISIYIQIQNQYESTLHRFENSLDNIKKTQIPVLSQALWNIDYQTIDIILNNLLNNDKIIYAQIVENGEIVKKSGVKKELDVIEKEFDITREENSQSIKIGELKVIANLEPLYEDLKQSAINIIITEIVKMLLISFLIIFFMKRLLTDYLEKLSEYAQQLSLENLDKPFKTQKQEKNIPNELNILGKAINTMRINLVKQIKESEEKNNMLSQQSRMAAMGEMIGNIAHQWRQPLSVITTLSSGLQLSYNFGKMDKKILEDNTNKIINSANYLSDTINDFRDFFKPDKEKKSFNLIKAFEKTFTLLNTQFSSNNITLSSNIKNLTIYGYENELIQVLINILNNAKDALVEKKEETPFVQIDTFIKDDHIHICIKDNAGGIKDEIRDRIFEPYFTTKGQTVGTGIGLYMSSQIIEKHMDGRLLVENTNFSYEGKEYVGAQFIIKIPKP